MTAGFNEAQSIALAVIPKISGTVGMMFCAVIIFTVMRDKNRRNKTYHRLLVGLSVVDMICAFWLALSTWPIPVESNVLWASGNDGTCTLQGFFTSFGVTSSFYNASISLYFLLVIRYGWKESQIKKIEPLLHIVPLFWGFGTSFAGLKPGIFGNAYLWCWIKKSSNVYRWAFFYGPLWTMIFLVTAMSTMIYQYVHQLEKRTLKYKYNFYSEQSTGAFNGVKTASDQVSRSCSLQMDIKEGEIFSECEVEKENEQLYDPEIPLLRMPFVPVHPLVRPGKVLCGRCRVLFVDLATIWPI
jgi:G protein-coupled glucose receptor regulating Gpa2